MLRPIFLIMLTAGTLPAMVLAQSQPAPPSARQSIEFSMQALANRASIHAADGWTAAQAARMVAEVVLAKYLETLAAR